MDPLDPLDPVDPDRCTLLLEIETLIEVEHFDPRFPLYCRTFQKLDVQKHRGFDELLSIWVQKHKENATCSIKSTTYIIYFQKMFHVHCTFWVKVFNFIVLSCFLDRNASFFIVLSCFFDSPATSLGPGSGPRSWAQAAHGPRPRPRLGLGPSRLGPESQAQAHGCEGPNYTLKLPIHRHRAALLVDKSGP